MEKNNDTKDYSELLEFLNSEPYYASKKIVDQSSDFLVRRTGSYLHKKSTDYMQKKVKTLKTTKSDCRVSNHHTITVKLF